MLCFWLRQVSESLPKPPDWSSVCLSDGKPMRQTDRLIDRHERHGGCDRHDIYDRPDRPDS